MSSSSGEFLLRYYHKDSDRQVELAVRDSSLGSSSRDDPCLVKGRRGHPDHGQGRGVGRPPGLRLRLLAAIQPSTRGSDAALQPRDSDRERLSLGGADLHRRTRHGRVGAEHAAVAGLGLEDHPAVPAIVEPLAGVGRHRLRLAVPARRTGDGCLQYYRCLLRRHIAYPVIARKTTSAGSSIGSRYPA